MKTHTLLLTLATLLLSTALHAGDTITEDWIRQHYQKTETMIEMRDGVKLYTAIYAPRDNKEKHPILIERTPYSCTPYGEDQYMRLWSPAWTPYVENGYIMVYQDVRGRNHSEGEYEDIRPFIENKRKKQTDDASDTYDTAEWLIRHTHNNGRIGVMGISYNGFYATMAALCGHPAIKAVSPQAPVTDWYRGDDAHHNGAFFFMMGNFSHWFQYQNCAHPATGPNPTNFPMGDAYNGYLKLGALKHLTQLLGDSVTMWNNVVEHPYLDQWWEDRNVSLHCHDVKPALMVVGGHFDAEDCYGAWRTYRAIKEQSPKTKLYLVEGPWAHGYWSRGATTMFDKIRLGDKACSYYYMHNIEYPFFAYYLEDKGDEPCRARIFQTGENQWTEYPEGWNLDESDATTAWYLGSRGTLSNTQDTSDIVATYTSDPMHPVPATAAPCKEVPNTYMIEDQRFAATRPDVATFETPALTDTLRATGPVIADLTVSMDATDADFIVKVIDVFPDDFSYHNADGTETFMGGHQMLVRAEVMRGKLRNSLSTPEPFTPGQPTQVRFSMPDIAHTWLPGHRLMVQVQSSWFPLIDRNPQQFCDIYQCDDSDFRQCTINIHSGSHVLLSKPKQHE